MEDNKKAEHRVLIDGRERLDICGVLDVLSFDETGAVIRARDDMGLISVDGEGLTIELMDRENGRVGIVGRINAVVYADKGSGKRGLFGRGR